MSFRSFGRSSQEGSPLYPHTVGQREEVPSGCTRDPLTGRVYRLTQKKVRSAEYAQLERSYAATSSQLKGYTNSMGWRFDTVRQISVDADNNPVRTNEDIKFVQLEAANEAAKAKIKAFKESHAGDFTPQRRKQGVTPAKLRRAEKTLERVARGREVTRTTVPRLLQGKQYPLQAARDSASMPTLATAPFCAPSEEKSSLSASAVSAQTCASLEVTSSQSASADKKNISVPPAPAGVTPKMGLGDEPEASVDALITRISGIETKISSLADMLSRFMAQSADKTPVGSPASMGSQVGESDLLSDGQTETFHVES